TANIRVAPVLVQLTSAVEECQAALWISGSWLARVMRMCAANLDDRATRLNAVICVDQGLSLRSSAALRPWASSSERRRHTCGTSLESSSLKFLPVLDR